MKVLIVNDEKDHESLYGVQLKIIGMVSRHFSGIFSLTTIVSSL